jgi:hypothetical protein
MGSTACPHSNGCEMYGLLKLSGTLAAWKINYCNGDFARCERFRLAALGRHVPPNLMPNGALLRSPESSKHKVAK